MIAKRNPSYLFTAAGEKGRYEDVFGAQTTATKIALAVWLLRELRARRQLVQSYKEQLGLDLSWVPQADMFLLALLYLKFFEPRDLKTDEDIAVFHDEARKNFEDWYVAILREVDEFISDYKKKQDYNPPKFFKNEKNYVELARAVAGGGGLQGRLAV